MQIPRLFCYPIKLLREVALGTAEATSNGIPYDRRFMLIKVLTEKEQETEAARGKAGKKMQTMTVRAFGKMSWFHQSLLSHSEGDSVVVTFEDSNSAEQPSIEIPLTPDVKSLPEIDPTLYGKSAPAFDMKARYNDWYSKYFNFPVMLAYLGPNLRKAKGSLDPGSESWYTWLMKKLEQLPFVGRFFHREPAKITLSDAAAYLVITEESNDHVTTRLPEGETMDITKFRPNIVVADADAAWDEDFWAGLKLGNFLDGVDMILKGNCERCNAINVDYNTGATGKNPSGNILNTLRKDRSVDPGYKAPVFGRYGFLTGKSLIITGANINVGDEVHIIKRNEDRTVFRA